MSWFTMVDMSKVKQWVGLARLFVEQYKLNTEIASNKEELERMNKKPSEIFREYAQRWCQEAS